MARIVTGIVASDKADKTIVVAVATRKTHPLYKKQYTNTKRFIAHDAKNEAKVGDKVTIIETRPISARKHFSLQVIVERAGVAFEATDADAAEVLQPAVEEAKEAEPKEPKATKKSKEVKE